MGNGNSRAGLIAGIVVFVVSHIWQLVIGGFDQITRFNFWFGLYGWYCAAIVVGFLGMFLPALVTVQFIPPGMDISGFAVAAFQAQYLSQVWGPAMWFLTLLCGFWVLFSTQLGVTDIFVRMVTDILWTASARIRAWRGGDVRLVYYGILLVFTIWGAIAINLAQPLVLILIGANMAGFNFIVLSLHTLYVNRKFLPPELRPPRWRELTLVLAALFFAFFVTLTVLNQVFGMRL
jgi:hypothetical protein